MCFAKRKKQVGAVKAALPDVAANHFILYFAVPVALFDLMPYWLIYKVPVMLKPPIFIFFLFFSIVSQAQHVVRIVVRSEERKEPLAAASVAILSLHRGAMTDSTGTAVLTDIPNGSFQLEISYVGYTTAKRKLTLPGNEVLEVALREAGDEEDHGEVVVTATRTDRSVRNTPTRVEVIGGGEISENISMRPGEVRMLLNEANGINTQQTSAISSTANIRIQELEGRYTQVLKDGFPLYAGLSEGLSLVQIPPLDLKQVEIIKGSSSTLYGGGAIAGLINLVSKTPLSKREISFLANGTSAGGVDVSGFYGEKYGKTGLTIFASRNSGKPYDPAGIGLTAIPRFERYTVTPRFFLYGKKLNANIGLSYATESRLGGSMSYIKDNQPGYFERNASDRINTQLGITWQLTDHAALTLRNSYNHFNRNITIPSYQFGGLQQSSFSEISMNVQGSKSQWITGANLYTDRFDQTDFRPVHSYDHTTAGLFVQNTWTPGKMVSIESGLRADYTQPFGMALLPRLSVLFQLSDHFSSRIGGGLGYKIPTIFTEESEEQQYRNILPLDPTMISYERSAGGNLDFTWKANIDELKLTVNPMFFYTRIGHPLILQPGPYGQHQFVNAPGYSHSRGIELSLRLSLASFRLFTGYSYISVENHFNGVTSPYPLAPEHKLHLDLVYELEGRLRVALESYYTGPQALSDGSRGRDFWTMGALVEKRWRHFSLFINGEDLNDARQTRWESIYTGPVDRPVFRDIYAPLEGIVVNGGIKISL